MVVLLTALSDLEGEGSRASAGVAADETLQQPYPCMYLHLEKMCFRWSAFVPFFGPLFLRYTLFEYFCTWRLVVQLIKIVRHCLSYDNKLEVHIRDRNGFRQKKPHHKPAGLLVAPLTPSKLGQTDKLQPQIDCWALLGCLWLELCGVCSQVAGVSSGCWPVQLKCNRKYAASTAPSP